MKHAFINHGDNCPHADNESCPVCDGGLSICKVCSGAEGSLTTDCPGVRMTCHQIEQVYAGKLDFISHSWTAGTSPHSPRGHRLASQERQERVTACASMGISMKRYRKLHKQALRAQKGLECTPPT